MIHLWRLGVGLAIALAGLVLPLPFLLAYDRFPVVFEAVGVVFLLLLALYLAGAIFGPPPPRPKRYERRDK